MVDDRFADGLDEAAVRSIWEDNAAVWIEQVRAGSDEFRTAFNNPAFMAFVGDLDGQAVIDLGCGEGTNTRLFAERGARMTGVDLSPRMIDAARAREAAEPRGIAYAVCSYTRLPFADAAFDAAVSTMAFMDGPAFDAAARAAYRVLRPGGRLAFSVLHPCFITPGFRWLKDADGQAEGLVVADYFADAVYMERWRFSRSRPADVPEFLTPRFPHRLEGYINGLCRAGFRIERVHEPRPAPAQVAARPSWARMRRHMAFVLYVAASKA